MRTETMTIKEFMNRDHHKKREAVAELKRVGKVFAMSGGTLALVIPQMAAAAPGSIDGTFGNVHAAIMHAFDAGVVLVIIFAGAAWSLGHRSRAIELLLGLTCGYIIARHAVDIRDMLAKI